MGFLSPDQTQSATALCPYEVVRTTSRPVSTTCMWPGSFLPFCHTLTSPWLLDTSAFLPGLALHSGQTISLENSLAVLPGRIAIAPQCRTQLRRPFKSLFYTRFIDILIDLSLAGVILPFPLTLTLHLHSPVLVQEVRKCVCHLQHRQHSAQSWHVEGLRKHLSHKWLIEAELCWKLPCLKLSPLPSLHTLLFCDH